MGDIFVSSSRLIEKMKDIDPDIRHMAISDFNNAIEAGKVGKLEVATEADVVKNLMSIITKDPATNVKEVAVRCVELLATHLGFTDPEQGKRMLEGFMQTLISERRDEVSEMCVTTICILLRAAAVSSSDSNSITTNSNTNTNTNMNTKISNWNTGTTFYTTAVAALAATETDDQTKGRLMDVFDLLVRLFPGKYVKENSPMPTVLPYLSSIKVTLRRKAVDIVGSYYSYDPTLDATADSERDAELSDLVEGTLLPKCADYTASREKLCGYIRCIASLRAPHGIIEHVPQILSTLEDIIGDPADEGPIEEGDAYVNVREACFNAIEALHKTGLNAGAGRRRRRRGYPPLCKALLEHSARLSTVCLGFVKYDPNRTDFSDEMSLDDDDDDEGYDVFDADEFDELDNDSSWKVRRAAVRCLGTIITLQSKYDSAANIDESLFVLVERVNKEEDECIILAILDVLKDAISSKKCSSKLIYAIRGACANLFTTEAQNGIDNNSRNGDKKRRSSIKIKEACLGIIGGLLHIMDVSEITDVFGAKFVTSLISSFGSSAEDTTNEYRVAVLNFARKLLQTNVCARSCNYGDLVHFIAGILESDSHPSTVTEAARCAAVIAESTTKDVIASLINLLKRPAILLEAKKVVIECLGSIVSKDSSPPPANRDTLLTALAGAATEDEMLLLPALRVLRTAAPAIIALPPKDRTEIVSLLLHAAAKIDRQTKLAGLQCLDTLFAADTQGLLADYASEVMSIAGNLIEEADMYQSSVALQLATRVVHNQRCLSVLESHKHRIITLCQSQFMQQEVLDKLCSFLSAYSTGQGVTKNAITVFVNDILKAVIDNKKHKAASVAAAAVAALVSATDKMSEKDKLELTSGLVQNLVAPTCTPNQRELGFALLGEFGRVLDLSSLQIPVEGFLLQDEQTDSIRKAVVTAAGRLCVGAPAHFVPKVLKVISESAGKDSCYHPIHALETFIAEGSPEDVDSHLYSMTKVLSTCINMDNESIDGYSKLDGLRKTAAECYGRLLLVTPTMGPTLSILEEAAGLGHKVAFWAVYNAIYRSEGNKEFREVMNKHIVSFLKFIGRIEVPGIGVSNNLRREALHVLNVAVRSAFPMVREHLAGVLPGVFESCTPVDELIIRSKIGPYEFVEDKGIDTRKAAFACLQSISLQPRDGILCESTFAPSLFAACAKGLCDTDPGVKSLSSPILVHYLDDSNDNSDILTNVDILPALNSIMTPIRTALEKLQKQQQNEGEKELLTNLLKLVALIKRRTERDPYCCTLMKEHVPNYKGLLEYTEKQFLNMFKDACTNIK